MAMALTVDGQGIGRAAWDEFERLEVFFPFFSLFEFPVRFPHG